MVLRAVGSNPRWVGFSRFTFHANTPHPRDSKGTPARWWVRAGRPAGGGQQDRPPAVVRTSNKALPCTGAAAVQHMGGRRELLRIAMIQLQAAAWQQSKAASKAASDSHLPPTQCSLGSGCAVDEWHGASPHSSTLCEREGASKLTMVSLSVDQHSTAAPTLVRARS